MNPDLATLPTYRIDATVTGGTAYSAATRSTVRLPIGYEIVEKIVAASDDDARIAAHEAATFAGFSIEITGSRIVRTPAQKLRSRQIARANRLRKASR